MRTKSNYTLAMLFLFSSILFVACEKKIENISQWKAWFGDEANGYVKSRHTDKLNFRVQLRPAEYMMLNDLNSAIKIRRQIDSLKKSYGESLYFSLDISYDEQNQTNGKVESYGVKSYEEYASRIKQLAFDIASMVWIESGDIKVYPTLTHLERGYEVGNKTVLLLAFPKQEKTSDIQMVFNDEIFGTGINRFVFTDDRKAIPALPGVLCEVEG